MVTEVKRLDNSPYEVIRASHEKLSESGIAWLDRLRVNAMERFTELGFPSVKDEEWKYTNVAPIARLDFGASALPTVPVSSADTRGPADLACPEAKDSRLVFVNGSLRTDLSSVAAFGDGAVAIDLLDAIRDATFQELVHRHLTRSADYVANGFAALNTAFIHQGAFVYIPDDVIVKTPIQLLFIGDGAQVASYPRVLVVAGKNSRATLLESYVGTSHAQYFTNAVVELMLDEGARLEHYKVQREGGDAFHVATTAADLGRNASYDATTITLGAQLSRHDLNVTMDQEGAECWVDGLYLINGGQHTDTHSSIDHRKPHCTSHQLYKGILDGKSRAVFNGKIFVRHDAQKTDAMQTNKNLLLSNDARVDTKPQLEILADDVKCAHGAAVGQIDQDELFYLETRGIHSDLARNLLTYGFAEEVIVKIKIESIRQQLDEAVLNRLNARLEA
jgi:Fe-S cluster assembly protein SufD